MSEDLFGMADVITPMALRVVATLRIADRIAAGTTDLAELAAGSGSATNPRVSKPASATPPRWCSVAH